MNGPEETRDEVMIVDIAVAGSGLTVGYINDRTREFSGLYEVKTFSGAKALKDTGRHNTGPVIEEIFRAYNKVGICGLNRGELISLGGSPLDAEVLIGHYLKPDKVESVAVLFPTERLFESQGIARRTG
ncbi:hypothetical protein J4233_00490 [Candidatus Pacearchaeota archaeon]|nr:hypothetical protein [Candidatus Pacearchaeota archaeon]